MTEKKTKKDIRRYKEAETGKQKVIVVIKLRKFKSEISKELKISWFQNTYKIKSQIKKLTSIRYASFISKFKAVSIILKSSFDVKQSITSFIQSKKGKKLSLLEAAMIEILRPHACQSKTKNTIYKFN